MNEDNIKKAIAIMKRAKAHDSVYMEYWQSNTKHHGRPVKLTEVKVSERDLHACGNAACFGGHIAISPEFQADGGVCLVDESPLFNGCPQIFDLTGDAAVAYWLGVSAECADHFLSSRGESLIYGNALWEKVKAEHVIAALNQLLELGEEKCLELWETDTIAT